MAGLAGVWSVMREPLTSLTFSQMKEAAAASGLPVVELSHVRQSSSGGRGASKADLADAIDGLFKASPAARRDTVARYMLSELLQRADDERRDRLVELLERVGWHLVAGEPAPMTLRLDVATDDLPEPVRLGVAKAIRRFEDGDFDGAITSVVGVVDTLTKTIYDAEGLTGHKSAPYQERAVTAHKQFEAAFRAHLTGMSAKEADATWDGKQRALNGAAFVLGAFRRNFSDAHGASSADPGLVQQALQSALFVVGCLRD